MTSAVTDAHDLESALEALRHTGHHVGDERTGETFEEALAMTRQAFGEVHPTTARLYNLLAISLYTSDPEGALEAFEKALEIRRRTLAADHVSIAESLNNLAYIDVLRGDLAPARDRFEEALEIYEKALGPRHDSVARTLTNLGSVLIGLGELDEAQAHLERALEIAEEILGPRSIQAAQTLTELGRLYVARGLSGPAEEAFRLGVEALRHQAGQGVSIGFMMREILAPYADLLEEIGRADEARALREERETYDAG